MLTQHLRNILNMSDKYAFAVLGRIRKVLLFFFDRTFFLQRNFVERNVVYNQHRIKSKLISSLPELKEEIFVGEDKEKILSKAKLYLNKEFSILSKSVKFKDKIDWHLDFNSGYRWPKGKLYKNYEQVNLNNNADVKFPRELSRCHHFLTLGEAYIITNDEKYTKEFIEQVKSWIKENPYKKSINWGCSMDIAIRASNWIYALRMFLSSPLINDKFLREIFTSLYLHGRFIYENPEKNRINNHNHFLSDLAGQILLGFLFKDVSKEAELWFANGIYDFFKEIRIQILPTGPTYERSTNYHRLVTELISYTIILLKNNAYEIPQDIYFRVEKMFDFVLNYLFNDGTAPIIGDQDNGRFLPFMEYDINYHRYLLSIAANLFPDNIKYHQYSTKHADRFFLFKKIEDKQKTSKELTLYSKEYPDAGFFILRSKDVYVFINNSGLSHYNEIKSGTHTHSDLLSFVYSFKGTPFLIDPGTYVYSSNPNERMKFRSTYMHNTITVDDKNQNELRKEQLWFIKRDAIPKTLSFISDKSNDIDSFAGEHSGYFRFDRPVNHRRLFFLNKKTNTLCINDILEGKENHNIKVHFHFDTNIQVEIKKRTLYCSSDEKKIKIFFESDNEFTLHLGKEYISKAYNHKELGPYVYLSMVMENNIKLTTIIEEHKN